MGPCANSPSALSIVRPNRFLVMLWEYVDLHLSKKSADYGGADLANCTRKPRCRVADSASAVCEVRLKGGRTAITISRPNFGSNIERVTILGCSRKANPYLPENQRCDRTSKTMPVIKDVAPADP